MSSYNEKTPAEREESSRRYEEELAQRKEAERLQELVNLGRSEMIAVALNGVVLPAPAMSDGNYYNRFEVKLDEGGSINLMFSGWRDENKVLITGGYPTGTRDQAPGIKVSISKTDAQIVKDIQRRFIPLYREAYSKALAVQAAHEEQQNKRDAVINRLLAIKGVTTCNNSEELYISQIGGSTTGRVKYISSTGGFNLELSGVSVEKLRALLEL